MIGVDVVGPFPESIKKNKYLIVFINYLTKWPEAFAVANQNSETIAKLLVEEIICRHGSPKKFYLIEEKPSYLICLKMW